jgi:hypothetical protein
MDNGVPYSILSTPVLPVGSLLLLVLATTGTQHVLVLAHLVKRSL